MNGQMLKTEVLRVTLDVTCHTEAQRARCDVTCTRVYMRTRAPRKSSSRKCL